MEQMTKARVALPAPRHEGQLSVEAALLRRRSVRDFEASGLTLTELSQLLWAVQGVTDASGYRTAPSAGALYPLEVYVVVGTVEAMLPGIYKYDIPAHGLRGLSEGDRRRDLSRAALGQSWIEDAAAALVIAGVYKRTTRKYGERGVRYVHMEVGHAAQNVYLQAEALQLGTTMVGAFEDEDVTAVVGLDADEAPLCILPVGRPR